jgi:hypothetical protein
MILLFLPPGGITRRTEPPLLAALFFPPLRGACGFERAEQVKFRLDATRLPGIP